MSEGVCKLTGMRGQFVKSHLIPQALTKLNSGQTGVLEFGNERRPLRRWSSWYDGALVTQDGENILTKYDTWAIAELRRLKLIWSSWGPMRALATADRVVRPYLGLRTLECSNPSLLRLFFLSLLWRAAASHRPEFSQIKLSPQNLEKLRLLVRNEDPGDLNFFPTSLLQIDEMGPRHNFAPLLFDKTYDLGEGQIYRHYVFRFYFDGLISNMHCSPPSEIDEIGPFIVGHSSKLVIQTQRLEESFQLANLKKGSVESALQWPRTTSKLARRKLNHEALRMQYAYQYGFYAPWTARKE